MKKYVAIFLSLIIIWVMPLRTFALTQKTDLEIINIEEEEINKLLDKRAELISLGEFDEIPKVEKQLEGMEVFKMTETEVQQRFNNDSVMSSNEILSTSDNISWFSSTQEYTYGGSVYVIETITAQPNEKDSSLKQSGYKAVDSTYGWKAGFMTAISGVLFEVGSEASGTSAIWTFFDLVNKTIEAINPTTEIKDVNIVYTYASVTTVQFKFVNKKGMSSASEMLSYRGTKCVTAVGYQIPHFVYGENCVSPEIISETQTIDSEPSGYNSNINAIRSYLGISTKNKAFVYLVDIGIIENEVLVAIYPVQPLTPTDIF